MCRAVDGLPLAIELAAGHCARCPCRCCARDSGPGSGRRRRLPMAPTPQQPSPPRSTGACGFSGPPSRACSCAWVCLLQQSRWSRSRRCAENRGADILESLIRLMDHSLVRQASGPRGGTPVSAARAARERDHKLLAAEGEIKVVLAQRHAEYVAAFLDDLDEARWSEASGSWIDEIPASSRRSGWPTAGRWITGTHDWPRESPLAWVRTGTGRATTSKADDGWPGSRARSRARRQPGGSRQSLRGFVEWTEDQALARRYWDCRSSGSANSVTSDTCRTHWRGCRAPTSVTHRSPTWRCGCVTRRSPWPVRSASDPCWRRCSTSGGS